VDAGVLEEVACGDAPLELGDREEVVVDAVGLAAAGSGGSCT
jgi:hypothetical protein